MLFSINSNKMKKSQKQKHKGKTERAGVPQFIQNVSSDSQTRDSINQMKVRLSCPFCNKPGKKKIYPNLFQLHYHFTYSHGFDYDCKKIIEHLEYLIGFGVLRC